MAIEVFAPAKINLTLHVTGQRADGYHLLDSLVVFASIGDSVRVTAADGLGLTLDGPEAGGLIAEPDNLVLKAARLIAPGQGAQITLTKRLPVASGIGGGSADAAAALRALAQHWFRALPSAQEILSLGADVPVSMSDTPQRMSGIGEVLADVPSLPAMDILLVNPRVSVSTPKIFRALETKTNPPMPPEMPHWAGLPDFIDWLKQQRNDLLPPARGLQPVIGEVLQELDKTGCLYAGMSGSGATCFALFPPGMAQQVPGHTNWWQAAGRVL